MKKDQRIVTATDEKTHPCSIDKNVTIKEYAVEIMIGGLEDGFYSVLGDLRLCQSIILFLSSGLHLQSS